MATAKKGKSKEKDRKRKNRPGHSKPKGGEISGGLSKSRIGRRAGLTARLIIDTGNTKCVQFLGKPDNPADFKEYETHAWREKGQWHFVPCLPGCPLDDDEDEEVRKTSYRFCCNVWSFKDKAVKVFEGGTEIATKILLRYESKKKTWLQRTFDISKIKGERISWDIDTADKKALRSTDGLDLHDLDQFIIGGWERYFSEEYSEGGKKKGAKAKKGKEPKKSAMDDDDDEQEDSFDADELLDKEQTSLSDLKKIATSLKIKLVDKEGVKRDRKTLVRLIIKKQDS